MLADVVPLYPLYALFFADSGMSDTEISALFAVWSVTGLLAEVPSGALSDRFPRRHVLGLGGVLQAGGYAVWLALPGFAGFAAGFVLWGIGTSLFSGTVEALVFEGLSEAGVPELYPTVRGRITAAGHLTQLPSAAAATLLFAAGAYAAAGWVSVGTCLAAAALAQTFPEPPRAGPPPDEDAAPDGERPSAAAPEAVGPGYLATLRVGVAEAAGLPLLRGALLAVALVNGMDALEEYFPLIVGQGPGGADVAAVPLLLLVVALAGAGGAGLGGRASRLGPFALAGVFGVAGLALGFAGAGGAAGLVALGVFYGLQQCVLVVVDSRLQERVSGRARATVTSVAALGAEVVALAVFAAWALGGSPWIAVGTVAIAVLLPRVLRRG